MKSYSLDFRQRVLAALDHDLTLTEASRRYGVGTATLKRWRRLRRLHGTPAARPKPGRPPVMGSARQGVLDAQLRAAPDATLAMHQATWAREQGEHLSLATFSRQIRRLGWTLKKK